MKKLFHQGTTWPEMFGSCDLDEKKMILSRLIHKVHIWKDNQIEIEFNIQIQQILVYKQALNQVSAQSVKSHFSQINLYAFKNTL